MTTAPSVTDNETSRFRVTDLPYAHPGHCAVCGAADRPVVDFGTNVQRYGAIMLCEFCVCEAAERFGMVRPDVLEASQKQTGQSIEDYLAENNLKVITDELYDALVVSFGHFSNDLDSRYGSVDSASDESDEGAEGAVPDDVPTLFDELPDDGKKSVRKPKPLNL